MTIDLSALTERQRMVFDTIVEFWKEHFHPPTIRQLAALCGISSPNGMVAHLKYLRKKGFLLDGDFHGWQQIIPTTIRISFDHEVETVREPLEAR